MIFSCTKKVQDKLKKHKNVENDKVPIGLHNWYIDLVNLERKNYFLFTNSLTLFSFFIYAGTQQELNNIENLFEEKLEEQVIREIGVAPEYLKSLLPDKDYRFLKTNSRSVLGSMNDFKYQIKVQLEHRGKLEHHYDLIHHLINSIPMGGIKYGQPTKVMKEKLDSLKK